MVSAESPAAHEVTSFAELREFVRHELCARESLLEDQFPLTESPMKRGDTTCGMQFVLHGPRNVRLSAVWTADHNTIYFYAADGERFAKVLLSQRFAVE